MNLDETSLETTKEKLLVEAEKLIWAFLDEQIEEEDAVLLEGMIKENEEVRSRYVACAQIHADLYKQYQFGAQTQVQLPVLDSVDEWLPSTGNSPQVTD